MKNENPSLEYEFFDSMIEKYVHVFLPSGIKLRGYITKHNERVFTFRGEDDTNQLVYKAPGMTVLPQDVNGNK